MAVKWMNGLVVFVFVMLLLVNKDYFIVEASQSVENLEVRSSARYIKDQPLIVNNATEATPKSETQILEKRFYVFKVSNGMSSEEVSEMIYELELATDKLDFNKYLVENGYATKIQVGTYNLTDKMSFQDIAKLITKR